MKKVQVAILLLVIIWIGVIFEFSLHSGQSSHLQSQEVTSVLRPVAHHLGIQGINYGFLSFFTHPSDIPNSELFIRKLAHITEYFILGVLVSLFCSKISGRKSRWAVLIFTGALVALTDEKIIQAYITVGRTSSFKDVGIDCFGYFAGLLLYFLLLRIIRHSSVKKHVENSSQ